MAASEPCGPAKARLCVHGAVYRRYSCTPAGPPTLPPACSAHQSGQRRTATPGPEGASGLCLSWSCCADKRSRPAAGSMRSNSCPRRKRSCCAAHGARRAGPFPAHKDENEHPGLFQGQTAHKRVPGVLFLRCEFFPCAVVRTCLRTGCMCEFFPLNSFRVRRRSAACEFFPCAVVRTCPGRDS